MKGIFLYMVTYRSTLIVVTFILASNLAACDVPPSQVVATIRSQATQPVAEASPTIPVQQVNSPAATFTPVVSPSQPPTETLAAGPDQPDPALSWTSTIVPQAQPNRPLATPTPAVPCNRAAPGNPIDISIPDDTPLRSGQAFVKTWRLQNTGSCTWSREYAVVWFSGERFSGSPSTRLLNPVPPGQTVDVSVDLTAPETPGVHQSNWKLSDTNGQLFGIGPSGDAPIWVRIMVIAVDTPTPAPTPISPSTPPIYVTGAVSLLPGEEVDLDTNQVTGGGGADLLYNVDADGSHQLIPHNASLAGTFAPDQPSLLDCQTASLQTGPIPLDSVPQGSYACTQTNLGLPGWVRLIQTNPQDEMLSLEMLTWAAE